MRRSQDQFDGVPILGLTKFDRVEKDPRRFDGPVVINPKPPATPAPIETCASFSYKISMENYGGHKFEMADFFASKKTVADAVDEPMVASDLYEQCVVEVSGRIQNFISATKKKKAEKLKKAGGEEVIPNNPTSARNFEAWKAKQNGESPI